MNIQFINIKPNETSYIHKRNKVVPLNIYQIPQTLIHDTVSFSGSKKKFKKAPTVLLNETVGPQDRFKTIDSKEYRFINSTIEANNEGRGNEFYIDARRIIAKNCNIPRYINAPEIILDGTTVSEIRTGKLNMDQSNASLIWIKSQTISQANIFNSNVDCITLLTNDPIKVGRNLPDNRLTINNSTIKRITYPKTLPSQNFFDISNHSQIDSINFYDIVHKQVLYVDNSHIKILIDSRLPHSDIYLHNAQIDELRCNPKNLQMSGNNNLGDITFSCYFYDPGEDVEITIPTGTKVNGNIVFEQVSHIPGANYIINIEEGAQISGNISILKQNPKYNYRHFLSQSTTIEDKSAHIIINKNVKPK